ncbi:MAG: FecR domain-containing protein [Planctomycetota bacterium]
MKTNQLDLLHRYLDGALSRDELDALEELLRTSAEARTTLRSLATIDAKWQQIASNESLASPAQDVVRTRIRPRGVPEWLAWSAIAVSLIVGLIGWFRTPTERIVQSSLGIARVIRIEGDGHAQALVAGTDLFAGDTIAMPHGLIELAFRDTGVHVVATAPLHLKLVSDEKLSLNEGQVKLVVPPQGVGFVVDTAQRTFVDLGTSFVVTASTKGSEVLVLDGQVSVGKHDGSSNDLMREGEFAKFARSGKLEKRSSSRLSLALPELSLSITEGPGGEFGGITFGFDNATETSKAKLSKDVIGQALLPLIQSRFQDRSCLQPLKHGEPIAFRGIAGAFHEFPKRTGLTPYWRDGGWMAWHRGRVRPPRPGRYRFWGYADNHLLVAINGKAFFEGSRSDSPFRELGIPRRNNPSLPCLIAKAGFACSEWIELTGEPVQLDILFGEIGGNITSGLLLVEREGDFYEETFWGQPKWPLFLTDVPREDEAAEFKQLVLHLEARTMGSFSISEDAIWKVDQ